MRVRVIDVLELLAAGETPEQILAEYPYLEADDIAASLLYAARQLDHPVLAAWAAVTEQGDEPAQGASMRRIWIDAQLPPALAHWLQTEHGVDAVHVQDLGLLHARDSAIFTAARAADGVVVVVTKDDDFVKLHGQHGSPPHVVWLRCGNVTNRELRRIVLAAWPRVETLIGAGEPLVEVRRRG
jgi:predicted nuclease of predicted toxin-antitoxin system